MRLNEHEALLTSKVLLVPYSEHHVPTYHEWMQDETLQQATASEPLTLPEEYAMQKSWRTDVDKLTFIACIPPSLLNSINTTNCSVQPSSADSNKQHLNIIPKTDDTPDTMIGDVNLFLTADEDEDEEGADWRLTDPKTKQMIQENKLHPIIGEIEIMIASKAHQGKGLGREVLLVFVWYVLTTIDAIMSEYHQAHSNRKGGSYMKFLRVKIDKDNERSIKLFEGAGFKKVSDEPNYFGELELRWPISITSMSEVQMKLEAAPRKMGYNS